MTKRPIRPGDVFVWTEDHNGARENSIVSIRDVYVDGNRVPRVVLSSHRGVHIDEYEEYPTVETIDKAMDEGYLDRHS